MKVVRYSHFWQICVSGILHFFLKNRFELEIIIRQRQRRDTGSDSDETNSIVDHMLLELRTKKRTLARTELRHLDYTTGSVVFSSF